MRNSANLCIKKNPLNLKCCNNRQGVLTVSQMRFSSFLNALCHMHPSTNRRPPQVLASARFAWLQNFFLLSRLIKKLTENTWGTHTRTHTAIHAEKDATQLFLALSRGKILPVVAGVGWWSPVCCAAPSCNCIKSKSLLYRRVFI